MPEGWRSAAVPESSDWVSAVAVGENVAAHLAWRPSHPLLDAVGSYLDFAILEPPALGEIVLVSVHVPTRWQAAHWASLRRVESMPTGLKRPWPSDELLDALGSVLEGREAIIAGDWNEAPGYPAPDDPGTSAFFSRAGDLGWREVVSEAFGGVVRTAFTNNAAYQNDHVFVTPGVWPHVERCFVFAEPNRASSDHAGIAVDLDI